MRNTGDRIQENTGYANSEFYILYPVSCILSPVF
jgi:hypothetical protein